MLEFLTAWLTEWAFRLFMVGMTLTSTPMDVPAWAVKADKQPIVAEQPFDMAEVKPYQVCQQRWGTAAPGTKEHELLIDCLAQIDSAPAGDCDGELVLAGLQTARCEE